jgi:peptide maturation system protein (TIGR04066 family)
MLILSALYVNPLARYSADEYHVRFDYLFKENEKYSYNNLQKSKIRVPIITIGGLSENCCKFETQLVLRRFFLNHGYKISQIGSKQYCELLGFHSFPSFMFDKKYNEIEKINNLYNLIIDIQNRENPDVFIIGIPGGIMPLNKKYHINYGITAFEVYNAITPDFNILNLWCDNFNEKFIEEMKYVLKYKFNVTLDCTCISNICVNNDSIKNDNIYLEYNVYTKNKVNEIISNIDKNIHSFNVLDGKSQELLYDFIIQKLST